MRRQALPLALADGRRPEVTVISVNTVIVGAGAAGLRCAEALYDLGQRDLAVVFDHLGHGTSIDAGSDKQTYYKIGLFGDEPDSPMDFARSLFQGGMMHGDLAYVEGLGSAPAFFELCRIGVPFPQNRFGGYVGYKTDHDPRQRATSAGPKTSKYMAERLLEQVRLRQIPILDHHDAVRLLTLGDGAARRVAGVLCLHRDEHFREAYGLTVINARNVVLATGGPGELYRRSVWPHGQVGSHGLALAAGVVANNLTELQYGLASIGFRWNLSGTYQQVIPDYYSTAADGVSDRRRFLHDYFPDLPSLASAIFLKGYQWPFHAARLQDHGSSLVDLAVHLETEAGRRVFMDFMNNPSPAPGQPPFALADLQPEARRYLERSGALQSTPYERLRHMNPQSIELYAEHGVDLREPLEIAVCAQHCNGGLRGNLWWETSLANLFAIGELNGTHGVRPGGSALNSGQVGALRAAQYIARVYAEPPPSAGELLSAVSGQIADQLAEYDGWLRHSGGLALGPLRRSIQERMSRAGAQVRSLPVVEAALREARDLCRQIAADGIHCTTPRDLPRATQDKWLALTSVAFLEALRAYIERGGGSRGASMVLDPAGSLSVATRHGAILPHRPECLAHRGEILEVSLVEGSLCDVATVPVPVRPLPVDASWFETTWAAFCRGEIYR
ncbi:MAG: FAD-binding protein [Lentisphaerae bacterium]|nr:FAD-binding protein [Lentisphaerota bacterium]